MKPLRKESEQILLNTIKAKMRRICPGQLNQAEEVLQDTLLVLHQHEPMNAKAAFAYAKKTAVNRVIEIGRDKGRLQRALMKLGRAEILAARERNQQYRNILAMKEFARTSAKLDNLDREILFLFFREGNWELQKLLSRKISRATLFRKRNRILQILCDNKDEIASIADLVIYPDSTAFAPAETAMEITDREEYSQ